MPNGSMKALHDSEGRVRGYRVRWRKPDGTATSATFDRSQKRIAEQLLVKVRAQSAEIAVTGNRLPDLTVGEFVDRVWWPRQAELAAHTRDSYRNALDAWIRPELGSTLLKSVTVEDIEDLFLRIQRQGRARATAQKVRTVLSAVWTTAVRLDYASRHVVALSRLPGGSWGRGSKGGQIRVMTTAQVESLLEHLDPAYRGLVLVGAVMGLRPGEAAALRVGNVDLDEGRLTVEASLSIASLRHQEQGALRKAPKTAQSVRTLRMPERVRAAMAPLVEGREPEELLFQGPKGGVIRWANLRKRHWRAALEAAGITEPFTPHDLRHTAASQLLKRGAPVPMVAGFLGHRTPAETMRTYAHLIPGDGGLLSGLLDRIWEPEGCTSEPAA
jgi:integrase